MIELQNVTKEYSKGNAALNGVSVKIEQGEFVFVSIESFTSQTPLFTAPKSLRVFFSMKPAMPR